jgi:hypothetical protein
MLRFRIPRLPVLAAAAGLAFVLATPLQAQEPVPPPAAPDAPVQLDDETLTAFAEAYLDVGEINQRMEMRLAGVQDPQEAMQIQESAQQEMVEAVEAQGLSAEEYQQIAHVINEDEEVRERFAVIFQQVQEGRDTR